MRSAVVAATFAGLAAASWSPSEQQHGPGGYPHGGEEWTTEMATAWTTYCPEATEITHSSTVYTATEATTMVIPCPGGCYTSYPVTSWATSTPVESSPVTSVPPPAYTTPVAPTTWETTAPPATTAPPPAPYPVANGTTTWSTVPVASTGTAYPSSPVPATGGAATLSAAGAAIMAVFGLVAAL